MKWAPMRSKPAKSRSIELRKGKATISDLIRQWPNPLPHKYADYLLDEALLLLTVASCSSPRSDRIGSFLLLLLTLPQIGPDRFLPAPPHLAADQTGTDPSCSSSPHRRSDRNGPLLLLAENGPLQFLLLSAGPDPL
ncbi:hypothetical protein NQZ68_021765 [Dissostichus eleginoides]|nr:hypothetical protein NQZ68_021765 [Dissostichus eleginoides]